MDDDSNRLLPDRRATRRDLLLRRLAQMLAELRQGGTTGPAAFEMLVRRSATPAPPAD
jgi:hypothetical protein